MPPKKRILAEIDPNTTRISTRTKRAKTASGNKEQHNAEQIASRSATEYGVHGRQETMTYATKDNSKLRTFLLDRGLSTEGTREELISRLENSSIDYESLQSCQLEEMMKRRQITMTARGSKDIKIERLRLNDKLDRDTGNSRDSALHGALSAIEMVLRDCEQGLSENQYASWTPARLMTALKKRNLSSTGSKAQQIARLQSADRKRLNKLEKSHALAKKELELRIGHPVHIMATMDEEKQQQLEDHRIQQQQVQRPRIPICDYKWQDSHWASRTERQLREICDRRGMEGSGPKATMIKWLETGSVDYEDVYTFSLRAECEARGLRVSQTAKKSDLVQRLRDDDKSKEGG
ncbi:hypothetical protein B0O99DRAFT_624913 [Bisporella sp. PMI_857]|nr:hypothetical protein B0O99DRAFT_624913 [Bisporella sp. PMI_857]